MRYNNQICDGCGKTFTDDDDIVVCPECATPQHRECYNKNSCCVNADRHGDDFSWQGNGKFPAATDSAEKTKTIPCPNCGYENPAGSDHCKQCSMKFTLFGFNVVDAAAEEEEKEKTTNDFSSEIPSYKPPFTLGEGEGFENSENSEETSQSEPAEIEEKILDAMSTAPGFSPDGQDFSFGGPFPKEDRTSGVHTNLMGAFIGPNAMKYIEKFKRMDSGKKLSFNWAAFFFTPYWFFYRKLIKPGIIFMTVSLCLSIVATPYYLKFYEQSEFLMEQLASITTEAQLEALLPQLETLYTPIMIFTAIQFIVNLICGFIANPLYRKYAVTNISNIGALQNQKNSLAYLLRNGGASPLFALFALFAENILSSIAGMFM